MDNNNKDGQLIRPCREQVKEYLNKWKKLPNYVEQEKSLDLLFIKTFPNNNNLNEILIKVSCLNDFYSTNIFDIYHVGKHIKDLNLDNRLKAKDLSLVNDIAKIQIKNKDKNFYFFATKYCSHHYPFDYPIYDYYVDKVLREIRNKYKSLDFENDDLKDYPKFKSILENFQRIYHLEKFNLKQIDRYLWQLGKHLYPRNYKNKKKSVILRL